MKIRRKLRSALHDRNFSSSVKNLCKMCSYLGGWVCRDCERYEIMIGPQCSVARVTKCYNVKCVTNIDMATLESVFVVNPKINANKFDRKSYVWQFTLDTGQGTRDLCDTCPLMLLYHLQATRGGLPSVRLVNSAKILLSREAHHHRTVFTVLHILYNWEINAFWASRDCY